MSAGGGCSDGASTVCGSGFGGSGGDVDAGVDVGATVVASGNASVGTAAADEDSDEGGDGDAGSGDTNRAGTSARFAVATPPVKASHDGDTIGGGGHPPSPRSSAGLALASGQDQPVRVVHELSATDETESLHGRGGETGGATGAVDVLATSPAAGSSSVFVEAAAAADIVGCDTAPLPAPESMQSHAASTPAAGDGLKKRSSASEFDGAAVQVASGGAPVDDGVAAGEAVGDGDVGRVLVQPDDNRVHEGVSHDPVELGGDGALERAPSVDGVAVFLRSSSPPAIADGSVGADAEATPTRAKARGLELVAAIDGSAVGVQARTVEASGSALPQPEEDARAAGAPTERFSAGRSTEPVGSTSGSAFASPVASPALRVQDHAVVDGDASSTPTQALAGLSPEPGFRQMDVDGAGVGIHARNGDGDGQAPKVHAGPGGTTSRMRGTVSPRSPPSPPAVADCVVQPDRGVQLRPQHEGHGGNNAESPAPASSIAPRGAHLAEAHATTPPVASTLTPVAPIRQPTRADALRSGALVTPPLLSHTGGWDRPDADAADTSSTPPPSSEPSQVSVARPRTPPPPPPPAIREPAGVQEAPASAPPAAPLARRRPRVSTPAVRSGTRRATMSAKPSSRTPASRRVGSTRGRVRRAPATTSPRAARRSKRGPRSHTPRSSADTPLLPRGADSNRPPRVEDIEVEESELAAGPCPDHTDERYVAAVHRLTDKARRLCLERDRLEDRLAEAEVRCSEDAETRANAWRTERRSLKLTIDNTSEENHFLRRELEACQKAAQNQRDELETKLAASVSTRKHLQHQVRRLKMQGPDVFGATSGRNGATRIKDLEVQVATWKERASAKDDDIAAAKADAARWKARFAAAQAKLASGSSEVNKSLKVKVCMGVCMLAPPPRELPAFNSVIAAGVHTSLSVTWPRNTSEHKLPWRS